MFILNQIVFKLFKHSALKFKWRLLLALTQKEFVKRYRFRFFAVCEQVLMVLFVAE